MQVLLYHATPQKYTAAAGSQTGCSQNHRRVVCSHSFWGTAPFKKRQITLLLRPPCCLQAATALPGSHAIIWPALAGAISQQEILCKYSFCLPWVKPVFKRQRTNKGGRPAPAFAKFLQALFAEQTVCKYLALVVGKYQNVISLLNLGFPPGQKNFIAPVNGNQ